MHNHPSKAAWRKSTFCNGADACVEVAEVDGLVLLRDSKDPDGPRLVFTPEEWAAFTSGVRDGEFDLPTLTTDGRARVSEPPQTLQEPSRVSR